MGHQMRENMKITKNFGLAFLFQFFVIVNFTQAEVVHSNNEYILNNGKFKAIINTRIQDGNTFDLALVEKALDEFDNSNVIQNGKTSKAIISELIKAKAKNKQIFHFLLRPIEGYDDFSIDCGFSKNDNSGSKSFFDDRKGTFGMIELSKGTYKYDFMNDVNDVAKVRLIATCLNKVVGDSLKLLDAKNVFHKVQPSSEAVNAFSDFLEKKDEVFKFVGDRDKRSFLKCLTEEKLNSYRGNIYSDQVSVSYSTNSSIEKSSKSNFPINFVFQRKFSEVKRDSYENFSDILIDGSFEKSYCFFHQHIQHYLLLKQR